MRPIVESVGATGTSSTGASATSNPSPAGASGGSTRPAWESLAIRNDARERVVQPLRQLLIAGANQVVARLPGHRLRRNYYRHVLGWKIGAQSSIHQGLLVYGGRGRVWIGERSTIQVGCLIAGVGMCDLRIGNDVAIAYRTTIILGGHDVHSADFHAIVREVSIEDHVFVGANAVILGGVTLGQGCVVGSGAVVSRSVAPYSIVTGNPAKVVGERRRDLAYTADHEWLFH